MTPQALAGERAICGAEPIEAISTLRPDARLVERIARAWCRLMHHAPMRPVRGCYRCPDCLRTYPVPWETR